MTNVGDVTRRFQGGAGRTWTATVRERPGPDYKGRFYFHVALDDEPGEGVSLLDVRWNSLKTAERTLHTMSDVELRRRLRSALGRGIGSRWE